MKIISVVAIFFLFGCVASPSLEELEDTAMQSGDWTEVEKRELSKQRRIDRSTPVCEEGATHICVENGSQEDCTCFRPSGR